MVLPSFRKISFKRRKKLELCLHDFEKFLSSLVLDAISRYFFESIVALSYKCHESIYESITCITDSGGSLKGEALAALQLRCASSLRDTRGEARFN